MASATDSPVPPANRTSLRFRLATALLLLGAAVLAGQALVVAHFFEQLEEEFIDDILAGEMPRFIARSGGAPEGATSGLIAGYVVGSASDRGRLPFEFRALPEGAHDVFIGGMEYHVAVRHANGVEYYLAYDVSRHETRIRAFKQAVLALRRVPRRARRHEHLAVGRARAPRSATSRGASIIWIRRRRRPPSPTTTATGRS